MYPMCLTKARLQRKKIPGSETDLGDGTLLRPIDQARMDIRVQVRGGEIVMSNNKAIGRLHKISAFQQARKDISGNFTSFPQPRGQAGPIGEHLSPSYR